MENHKNDKLNYYYPSKYIPQGTKPTTVDRLDNTEDAHKKIESGNLVHIPFISKVYVSEEKEAELTEFNELAQDPRHEYERYDLILANYLNLFKDLIAQKKFDEKEVRKYLLVKLLVTKAIHLNPQFAQIGKALSIVEEKNQADSIREKAYKHEKTIGFNSSNVSYSDQDQKELQEALIQYKGLSRLYKDYYELTNKDLQQGEYLHQVYNQKLQTVGFSTRKQFLYYNLEAIRVTNLAIDEIIAGERGVHNQYDVDFFFYTVDQSKISRETTKVFSLINDVSLELLKKEANLSDDILAAAKKVAKVLADHNKLYIHKQIEDKTVPQKFFEKYYNLYSHPAAGAHAYIPPEIQPVAYIYLNSKLTNKNINKIDE